MNSRSDVREDLRTFFCGKPIRGEKLGVGIYRGEVVAEIVGNLTRHSTDGRQPLGFEQLPVGLLNFVPHAGECCS
jgi:hypothetical protein